MDLSVVAHVLSTSVTGERSNQGSDCSHVFPMFSKKRGRFQLLEELDGSVPAFDERIDLTNQVGPGGEVCSRGAEASDVQLDLSDVADVLSR